ncbi:hypothetical protein BaRGS_00004067 [Batillaria attramentaria]|uniref:COX assembly mitochondrial protein n=1 Tax=Batillaria attramentaria TaxID=370345 RepID=A0ABD0LYM9_9CAEN
MQSRGLWYNIEMHANNHQIHNCAVAVKETTAVWSPPLHGFTGQNVEGPAQLHLSQRKHHHHLKVTCCHLFTPEMHPDLASHLHTPECNALIEALQRCHVEHPVKMYMGYCNDFERVMTKCLKRERLEKRRLNQIKAKQLREKIIAGQRANIQSPANEGH